MNLTLKNYFKLAWRNLWKNKAFSIINILGLSVGIAFTLLIGAYIWGELGVNHQLKNADFFFNAGSARYFKRNLEGWTNFSTVGYIELKPGFTAKDLEKPMRDLIRSNTPIEISKNLTTVAVSLKQYHLQAEGGFLVPFICTSEI